MPNMHYMAPEVLKSENKYSKLADVWSACVIIYILLQAKYPYKGKQTDEVLQSIKLKNFSLEFVHKSWKGISNQGKDFIF